MCRLRLRGAAEQKLGVPGGLWAISLSVALAWVGACSDDSSPSAPDGGIDAKHWDGGQDAADSGVTTDLSVPLVRTRQGLVHGQIQGSVAWFLGIPYAAPPVGDLRWKPPLPPDSWTGEREARAYGPVCPQLQKQSIGNTQDLDPSAHFSQDCPEDCQGDWCCVGSEDCLYANVWTTAAAPGEKRPVMVWIHGGGWNNGSGGLDIYQGAHLAELGAVVVTFNYRLGILGYLAHPALTAESPAGASGNYGGLDQVRLLEWVRDNIEQFGGDPDNVTIFGESAGASSVCDLVASPLAAGLFHRAVIESAACTSARSAQYLDRLAPVTGKQSAQALGETAAQLAGCDEAEDPVTCLRSKTVAELFASIQPASGAFEAGSRPFFHAIVDGSLLPEAPMDIIAAGEHNHVPVIGSVNQNEKGLWRAGETMPMLGGSGITMQDAQETVEATRFAAVVSWLFGQDRQQEVLAMYPQVTTGPEAVIAYEQLMTDLVFRCPLRRSLRAMAQWNPAYLGYFTRVPPGSFVDREQYGAVHSSEIPYVFGTLDAAALIYQPLQQADRDLSHAMMSAWYALAQSGDPGTDAVTWPAYQESSDEYLQWDWPPQVGSDLRKEQCDYIDAFRESDACSGLGTKPMACAM